MLMIDRKQNYIKCSIKTTTAEKAWKTKIETKNKGNKQKIVTNMVEINPPLSIITLNINGLNTPIRIGRVDQKTRPNYMLSTRNSLYI